MTQTRVALPPATQIIGTPAPALATKKLADGQVEASFGGISVILRLSDGYVNVTRLCSGE